jgi:ABC-2 type transport system ATP-binding protein
MRILTGYLPPTSGAAFIAGYNTLTDSLEARQHLGYLPETVPLYPEMSVEGYLAFVGRLRRVPNLWERIDEVIAAVDLEERAGSYIGQLSRACASASGWPRPCCTTRRCSSSTSRPSASTRARWSRSAR